MIDKYITKSDIVSWINLQDSNFSASDIPDILIDEAHRKVDAELVRLGVMDVPDSNDSLDLLKFASFNGALTLLCKSGIIQEINGKVLQERFGEVAYRYQQANPLFFFAQGSNKQFLELLPEESFRMLMYSFIRAYAKYQFYQEYESKVPKPRLAFDRTSRGYGWNIHMEVIESADKSAGDYYRDYTAFGDYYEDWYYTNNVS